MPDTVSISETIKNIFGEVHRLKEDNPVAPITIISPSISMSQSINRLLLKSGKPLLNVRIETFYQHVCRLAEPGLFEGGITVIDSDQANFILFEIIEQLKLEYFKAAHEFPSYIYFFYRVINELRINIPKNDFSFFQITASCLQIARDIF